MRGLWEGYLYTDLAEDMNIRAVDTPWCFFFPILNCVLHISDGNCLRSDFQLQLFIF